MVLALPLVAGLVLAPLLGGRLSALGHLRLRWVALFYVAFGLQIAAFPFQAMPWRTSDRVAIGLWLVSYALLVVAAAANLRVAGVPVVALGMLSNVVAVSANGGHMPALPSALRAAGLAFHQSRNSARAVSPHVSWLVDRWAVPSWIPWGNVFSVGDVLIAVGGLVFVLGATGVSARSSRIVRAPRRARPLRLPTPGESSPPA